MLMSRHSIASKETISNEIEVLERILTTNMTYVYCILYIFKQQKLQERKVLSGT